MPGTLLIANCRLLEGAEEVSIGVEGGVIRSIERVGGRKRGGRGGGPPPACEVTVDAEGRTVVSGFIDVHVQGAGGADVLDGTLEALCVISKTCASFGVTGFLATTVYRPGRDNPHLAVVRDAVGRDLGGAKLLGVHLEGPFISPERRGMIQPDSISQPSLELLEEIERLAGGSLKVMTIAPELDGACALIRRLAERGVVASFGHSNASYEHTLRGIEAGISHVTHLFNAMPSIHHRSPGPLIAIFKAPNITVQIIPDGVHLHHRVIRFAFDLLGVQRCITITDGMQAMGLPDGTYVYNGIEYESRDGTARYRDGTLIGTSLGMIDLVLRFMEFTGCTLEQAVRAASANPAALLGAAGRKGRVEEGMDADLVILDHDYSVWGTVVDGKVVFEKAP